MTAKTIIVTGASRGIGWVIARYLLSAPQSNNVIVLARTAEPLQELKDEYPNQVKVLTGDITDFSLGDKAVELALSSFGRLDGLVLNHGTLGQVSKIADADAEQWRRGFDINLISMIAFTRAVLPSLRKFKGRIIFTSSGAAVSAYQGWALYGATKAAMNHFTLSLGSEEPEVTSVSIRPGIVDTEMQREIREVHRDNMGPEMHTKFFSAYKDGKLLQPEQPGHVMAKLVLDAPKSLSGRFVSWNDKELEAFQEL